jgi:hypothetical protein
LQFHSHWMFCGCNPNHACQDRDKASSLINARASSDKTGISFGPNGIDVAQTTLDVLVQADSRVCVSTFPILGAAPGPKLKERN